MTPPGEHDGNDPDHADDGGEQQDSVGGAGLTLARRHEDAGDGGHAEQSGECEADSLTGGRVVHGGSLVVGTDETTVCPTVAPAS